MSSQTDFASRSPISHSHLSCFKLWFHCGTLGQDHASHAGNHLNKFILCLIWSKNALLLLIRLFSCTLAQFNLLILCQRASRGIFFSWLVSIKADISTASFTLSELLQSISFLLKNSVPSLLLKFFLYKWFLAYSVTSDYCGNVFH